METHNSVHEIYLAYLNIIAIRKSRLTSPNPKPKSEGEEELTLDSDERPEQCGPEQSGGAVGWSSVGQSSAGAGVEDDGGVGRRGATVGDVEGGVRRRAC